MEKLKHDGSIETEGQLRQIIKPPMAAIKQAKQPRLGAAGQRYVAYSSCVVITTRRPDGLPEVSVLGGERGLIASSSQQTLLIALDGSAHESHALRINIETNPFCGLFVLIPGIDGIMRINGTAGITEESALLEQVFGPDRKPTRAIRLDIQSAWSHCPKAFVRSQIWHSQTYQAPAPVLSPAETEPVHLEHLDQRCCDLISASPVLALGTTLTQGGATASPRGDPRGFVMVLDDHTLLVPDRPGNRLADNFQNILQNPSAALMFMIPGSEETLRVCGAAQLTHDPEWLRPLTVKGKQPEIGLIVTVRHAVLERSAALIRSQLWNPARQVMPETLPGPGEILMDQLQSTGFLKGIKSRVADVLTEKLLDYDSKKNLY